MLPYNLLSLLFLSITNGSMPDQASTPLSLLSSKNDICPQYGHFRAQICLFGFNLRSQVLHYMKLLWVYFFLRFLITAALSHTIFIFLGVITALPPQSLQRLFFLFLITMGSLLCFFIGAKIQHIKHALVRTPCLQSHRCRAVATDAFGFSLCPCETWER